MLNASPNSMGGGNVEDTLSVFKKAIKKFQEFAGLLPTGQLDEATKTKMAEPRCGVVDVMSMRADCKNFFLSKLSPILLLIFFELNMISS